MSFSRVCELLSSDEKQDIEEAKRIIKNESLYNAADESKNTLLHRASEVGNHEIVQFLIDSGSRLDVGNNLGKTPLVSTLETCNPSKGVIEILLKAGASISKQDNFGESAVSIVNSEEWLSEDTRRFEIYKAFLEKANDFDDFDLLINGNERIIKMLVQTNIDFAITDSEGSTLVHALAQNSNPGIMALLRGKNFDINACDNCGWTPLMCATFFDVTSNVEFLLDEGAHIDATSNDKKTALYIAYDETSNGEDNNCIQVLLERGADVQIEVDSNLRPTIFDTILASQQVSVYGDLALAHLALQEAKGVNITELIYNKINSHNRFETYFQKCKQLLKTEFHQSVTLLDILIASDRKLERYLHDKELTSKLSALRTVDYFDTVVGKRLSKTLPLLELRKTGASILCGLMEMDYESYHVIIDNIISYLNREDLDCLVSIQN